MILNNPRRLTASGLVKTGLGNVKGIFVGSASATPTIKVWDSTAASGTVLVNTFTPTGPAWYEFGDASFSTGLYVEISGTVDCTVMFK
jgi:hypothetical protein